MIEEMASLLQKQQTYDDNKETFGKEWLMGKFTSTLRIHGGKERVPGMTITHDSVQVVEEFAEKSDKAKIITKAQVTEIKMSGEADTGCIYDM